MKKLRNFILILWCFSGFAQIQNGPMLGYSAHKEQALWVQTTKSQEVQFAYRLADTDAPWLYTAAEKTKVKTAFVCEQTLINLEPAKRYEYRVVLDHKMQKPIGEQVFETNNNWAYRMPPPEFSFALGSCAYINEEAADRAGKPYGGDYQIFQSVAQSKPNFMLWLGDNVYFREPDLSSKSGMQHRYTHSRNIPELKNLLANVPQYAIWDDHDYGPNDSDRSFVNKELSKETFDLFWANPPQNHPQLNGITTQFNKSDCDFFLLDNRYNKAPNNRLDGDRTILGRPQLEWLKEALLSSDATFKFVAMGGQFLNTAAVFENYSANGYEAERQELIDFIWLHQIKNVVFLTGDRHHSELSQLSAPGKPTIYDLTVSPLTSSVHESANEANTLRVAGSHIAQRNFGLIKVSGPLKSRALEISIYSSDTKLLWQQNIAAQ
jgi:alkaline phosphatase D